MPRLRDQGAAYLMASVTRAASPAGPGTRRLRPNMTGFPARPARFITLLSPAVLIIPPAFSHAGTGRARASGTPGEHEQRAAGRAEPSAAAAEAGPADGTPGLGLAGGAAD
jgi:hypothetical protein